MTIDCVEDVYLKWAKERSQKKASRFVHWNGHTVYPFTKSHPMRYNRAGYKTQTLDLANPVAHWEDKVSK